MPTDTLEAPQIEDTNTETQAPAEQAALKDVLSAYDTASATPEQRKDLEKTTKAYIDAELGEAAVTLTKSDEPKDLSA